MTRDPPLPPCVHHSQSRSAAFSPCTLPRPCCAPAAGPRGADRGEQGPAPRPRAERPRWPGSGHGRGRVQGPELSARSREWVEITLGSRSPRLTTPTLVKLPFHPPRAPGPLSSSVGRERCLTPSSEGARPACSAKGRWVGTLAAPPPCGSIRGRNHALPGSTRSHGHFRNACPLFPTKAAARLSSNLATPPRAAGKQSHGAVCTRHAEGSPRDTGPFPHGLCCDPVWSFLFSRT